jgi:regulation of enolase protein 1 (concanavalin A-like superfamily)
MLLDPWRGLFHTQPMKTALLVMVGFASFLPALRGEEVLFQDNFRGKLGLGWSWVREHPQAWRATEHGLEVRIEPGNQWGPQNDAKNVLVRPAPEVPTNAEISFSAAVENHPTGQYEQVDLVWYYDDSNMVKLGEELVDGKLSVVMGREQGDKTRTIAIIPLTSTSVRLRLTVKGNEIRGEFRPGDASEWRMAGQCDLPATVEKKPRLSLQFYQGPPGVEHWARVTEFVIERKTLGR